MKFTKVSATQYKSENGYTITKTQKSSWSRKGFARANSSNSKTITVWSVQRLDENGYVSDVTETEYFPTLTAAKAFVESK